MPSVLIASDHAGFDLKERLKKHRSDIDWIDLGPASDDRVDYPDFADLLCQRAIATGLRGVLLCGSGQGMAMRANRYPEIRAALVMNDESAELSREHNDANVLCLGARISAHQDCERWLEIFLKTEFAGGRHTARVQKLSRPCS